jgi:hypothetical protein
VITANVVCFLMFAAGGALSVVTFARNGNSSVSCNAGFATTCAHHSYTLGLTLLIAGFVGVLLTIAVAGRLGIGFGLGMLASYQRRRASMMSPAQPVWGGGEPPGWVGGQPPGTPGSPTGPPL